MYFLLESLVENGAYAKSMLTSSIVQSLTSPSLPSNKLQSPGYQPHVTFNVHKGNYNGNYN